METDISLFIEILKEYVYYFINGNDAVRIYLCYSCYLLQIFNFMKFRLLLII